MTSPLPIDSSPTPLSSSSSSSSSPSSPTTTVETKQQAPPTTTTTTTTSNDTTNNNNTNSNNTRPESKSQHKAYNASIDVAIPGRTQLEAVVADLRLIEKEEADQLRVQASNSKSLLVRTTWTALKSSEGKVVTIFYQNLNAIDPTAAQFFMTTKKDKTSKLSLFTLFGPLVETIGDMDTVIEKACPIGQENAQRGIKSSHYSSISKALLTTMENVLSKGSWTRQTRDAWIWFINIVADAMLSGARGRSGNLMYGVSNNKSSRPNSPTNSVIKTSVGGGGDEQTNKQRQSSGGGGGATTTTTTPDKSQQPTQTPAKSCCVVS